jgi:hypothetical protein
MAFDSTGARVLLFDGPTVNTWSWKACGIVVSFCETSHAHRVARHDSIIPSNRHLHVEEPTR